ERIKLYNTLKDLQELEEEVEQINHLFLTCEQIIQTTRLHSTPKWLPFFLRPDLKSFEALVTLITRTHENFQQNRLSRVKEFVVHEGSFLISDTNDSTDRN
ncbi:MAG: hypothetical protein ACFFCQ_17640, partial [Promethearchaeota archaeon]